jgi:transposase
MKGLILTQQEQTRLQVLNQLVGGQVTTPEAAQVLGLSERHTGRMLAAYREEGAAALAHGNRGRRPANAVSEETRQQVITLARTRYAGFNHTHLTELLAEREGLFLTRSTVRGILAGAGIPSPRRRRPPRHRQRRERKAQEGMLLQLDGSPHDWLMGRGPALTLLLAVDDATGTIAAALLRSQEDTLGYLLLFQDIIRRHGIPLAVYTDRHAVFQHNPTLWDEDHQIGKRIPTQFARALKELGVTQVFARSPQAKGRVERANGTFQDRLVAELRLAGAATAAEANAVLAGFLPHFNARFGVPAAQTGSAYRAPGAGLDLASTLCIKNRRKVAKDNTVLCRNLPCSCFPHLTTPVIQGQLWRSMRDWMGTWKSVIRERLWPAERLRPTPGCCGVVASLA